MKKSFATSVIATALALALGFTPQLSAHAAVGAKTMSAQTTTAETVVTQESQAAPGDFPSAEALRQAVYVEEEYPYPDPNVGPDSVQRWFDMVDAITEKGYFYESAVGEGDQEIAFIGYDLRHGPARPDFLDIRQTDADEGAIGVLGVGDEYSLRVCLRNITPSINAENVAVSIECHIGQESLIVVVHITYGDSGQLSYAERFPVYNPQRKNFYANQDGTLVSLMNGKELLSSKDCNLLRGESFAVGYEEFDGALPYGKEYTCELRTTFSLDEILPTPAPKPAPHSTTQSSRVDVDRRPPSQEELDAIARATAQATDDRQADDEDYRDHPGPNAPERPEPNNGDWRQEDYSSQCH